VGRIVLVDQGQRRGRRQWREQRGARADHDPAAPARGREPGPAALRSAPRLSRGAVPTAPPPRDPAR
jgi:hypothetical protein